MQDLSRAWALYARGDFQGAENVSRELLRATPDDVGALCCNAMSRWELGADAQPCIADMRRAIALRPMESWLHHNLGTLLAAVGQIDDACASYRKAIELKPDDTQAFYGLSQNFKFTEAGDLVQGMLAQYAAGELPQRSQEYVCFALAKVYADLGRHARAIHFCLEGNWVAQRTYNREAARTNLLELHQLAGSGALRRTASSSLKPRVAPVFIVGMPRSGTTLVETILSRHPDVLAGGELPHIAQVEAALLEWARARGYTGGPYTMLKDVPADLFTRNAESVLGLVARLAAGKPYRLFTDKMPDNSQRVGLISRLFPTARIIYMRRHPLDCCISNFFLHFQRGNGFAFSQQLLGERYRQVAETMELWKRTLDIPILEVSYESLVSTPEPMIRRIVDFAGLDWNEAFLTPHQSNRSVGTANQYQVRQPINRGSIGRWRHYEEWIQPLIDSLGGMALIEAGQPAASVNDQAA